MSGDTLERLELLSTLAFQGNSIYFLIKILFLLDIHYILQEFEVLEIVCKVKPYRIQKFIK